MPLHLLGKKSWNVYNTDNIERVRRDEAAARDREQAEEQRLQEIDAERRLAILRGETPPPLLPPSEDKDREGQLRHRDRDGGSTGYRPERRKRKRHGEDDTDFEMRVARERVEGTSYVKNEDATAVVPHKSSDAPLTDAAGHIDLFGGPSSTVTDKRKNPEAEAEKARKKREYEDQYRMRFSNAAGFQASALGPWYAPSAGGPRKDDGQDQGQEEDGKDAFGRPDPDRKNRDAARLDASDPLAMMKRGAAKVREVGKERQAANEERERELRRMRREERRREKWRRRDGGDSDELERFSLDTDRDHQRSNKDKHRHRDEERRRHRHHHHHRHRSPHRGPRSTGQRHDHDT
ncbi:hypothetical protein AB5N19_01227 [Seiridium cardinale]